MVKTTLPSFKCIVVVVGGRRSWTKSKERKLKKITPKSTFAGDYSKKYSKKYEKKDSCRGVLGKVLEKVLEKMRKKALSQNRTKKSTTKSAGKDTKESAPISEYSRKEGDSHRKVYHKSRRSIYCR